jgi:beta-glucanase (GH16 family)
MHILKKKRIQSIHILAIILLILSGITATKFLMAHANSSNSVSLQAGETAVTGEITNYSGNDGGSNGVFPPSTAIDWPADAGYPTVHNAVGGTGTFDDPITVAINSKYGSSGDVPNSSAYHIGEKFYIPRLHLYFVAEDSCNVDIDSAACTGNGSMQDNSTALHMDLFDGNITDPSLFTNQQNCETSFGGNVSVIANASPGYPMPDQYPQGTSLFVAPDNCIGSTLWDTYSGWTIADGTTGSATPTGSVTSTNSTNTLDVDDSVQGSDQNQFNYSGDGWQHCQNCDYQSVGFSDGSNSWDTTAGDSVSVTFTGTQIKFYGVVGPAHGYGQVSIDGGSAEQIDFYAPAEAGNTLLYTSPILSAGQHTFKLTVMGSQNEASTGGYVNPDRVEITTGDTSTSSTSTLVTNPGTSKDALDPTASDVNWKMVWNDDFTGPTIDTSKWTVRDYPAGQFNNEQECYKDDGTHVRIDGTGASSHLVLEADQQSGDSSCPYISGRLDTQGKYAVQPPTSGKPVRVEASIQLPVGGNGIWPAFWMLGQNIDSVGWPDCGEIDIMENVPALTMSTIQSTVHGLNNASSDQQETLPGGTFSDGYHLIAMDWYTDHIVFSVDGHETSSIDTTQLGGDQVFDQPFYILLNLAVGGDWPGNADSSTPFPQQMNVAFVRVYQHN